jgi:hypothetical protein
MRARSLLGACLGLAVSACAALPPAGAAPTKSDVAPTSSTSTTASPSPAGTPPEGTLPPKPASGVRGTETDDPMGVYAVQPVLDNYVDEIRRAAGVDPGKHDVTVAGWCEVGVDDEHDGVQLWWKSGVDIPPAVQAVLDHAKANGVTPEVHRTPYDAETLQVPLSTLLPRMTDGSLGITMLGVYPACASVHVGFKKVTDEAKAKVRALVPSWVPLTFEEANPVAL